MAELDRRLRRTGHFGCGDDGAHGVQAPARERPGAGTGSNGPSAGRPEVDQDPASPANAQAAGEPGMAPIPSGGSASQFAPGAVDELPPVEELAQRLPAEVRTVMEELFRAKWTEVRRLRPEDLRS